MASNLMHWLIRLDGAGAYEAPGSRGSRQQDGVTERGILLQIPHEFILLQGIPVPEQGAYGTGLVFSPPGSFFTGRDSEGDGF